MLFCTTDKPYITLAPEDQELKIGSSVILECDASGSPIPKLSWKHNELPLFESNRILFGNENTELQIEHVKESDEGE